MTRSTLFLDRLRLRHLRLLELIERDGSLRAVAEELNLTQPAVSQMVKDLEGAFGVALVERSARGALLTQAGRHAVQRARAGLATFNHLAAELTTVPPTLMRIGTNPMLAYNLLPRAIRHLGRIDSSLRIRVNSGVVTTMMNGVLDGTLDCYVGRVDWDLVPASIVSHLSATPLMVSELTLACSPRHPLAERIGISPRELLDWPWALPDPVTNNRMSLDRAFRDCGLFPPSPLVEMAADPTAFIALADEIDVITCLPIATLSDQRLVPITVKELRLQPIITHFLALAETLSFPAIEALREALLRAATVGE